MNLAEKIPIEGVEVLTVLIPKEISTGGLIFLFVVGGIFLIGGVVGCCCDFLPFSSAAVIIGGALLFLALGNISMDKRPIYTVTITEETPMREVLNSYEIAGRDGKLYKLRPIKEENK